MLHVAEGVRFELTIPFGMAVFKTAAIDHSATLPTIKPPPLGPLKTAGGAYFHLPGKTSDDTNESWLRRTLIGSHKIQCEALRDNTLFCHKQVFCVSG